MAYNSPSPDPQGLDIRALACQDFRVDEAVADHWTVDQIHIVKSLVFDEARLAPEQTVAQELDLAPTLGEVSQHLKYSQQRTMTQRAAAAKHLLRRCNG